MRTMLFGLVMAFVVGLIATPLVRRLALRIGALDRAGRESRKVHVQDIPRLGGIAIVAAFFAPLVVVAILDTGVWQLLDRQPEPILALLGGGLAIALLGLYDDLKGASAKQKLAVQVAVASVLWALGFRIDAVDPPFFDGFHLGVFSLPITLLWIVGVTNAVNLIDGLDGLATGVATFGILPVVVRSVVVEDVVFGTVGACLVGALLAFLVYNWHPAKIFMGDVGSMFLGFLLAVSTVQTSQKGPVAASMMVPILALGLPIMDTLLAIARRAWIGTPIFGADRGHVHHRLRDLGLSQPQVVGVLYVVQACFVAGSILLMLNRQPGPVTLVLVASMVAAALLVRRIGYLQFQPSSLRDDLRRAAAFRAENQFLRRQIRRVIAELEQAGTLDETVGRLGPTLSSFGVHDAELSLLSPPGGVRRTWRWECQTDDGPTSDESQETRLYPLVGPDGEEIGTLRATCRKRLEALQVQMPMLESLARALGPVLASRLPANDSTPPTSTTLPLPG